MIFARLAIADGTLEALKWLALALMTLDHINKYLFSAALPGLFELGRLALPLFCFVLAYNLARPNALQSRAYTSVMKRLFFFGAAATPVFISIGGTVLSWWPLNVMFMLLAATGTLYLIEMGGRTRLAAACSVFLLGGLFVEYWWPALSICIAAWWYCKAPDRLALFAWLAATASLYFINRNFWALAAMPLIFAAPLFDLRIARSKYFFYAYYPAHLAALWTFSRFIK